MLIRLIIISFIVLGIMNCDESNPSSKNNIIDTIPEVVEDANLVNYWIWTNYQVSENDGVTFDEYETEERIVHFDSNNFMYYYDRGTSFTAKRTFSYEIVNEDTLVYHSEKISSSNYFEINGDSLITDYYLGADLFRLRYYRLQSSFPPENWSDSIVEF